MAGIVWVAEGGDRTMAQPNHVLRDLRRAAGLTQAQVVDRLAQELVGQGINASPDVRLYAAWERGEITWPGRDYRLGLQRVFGVSSDGALGFVSRSVRASRSSPRVLVSVLDYESEDELRRQAFLRGVAVVAFGAALREPLQPWLGVPPSQSVKGSLIGLGDVGTIEATTHQFADWDHLHGGGLSTDAVTGQLNWAATLLDRGRFANETVRRRMCSAVAELARVAGWSAYDAGLHAQARRALALGVHAAAEGDDWPLRSAILCRLARQAVTVGRPEDAIGLMSLAHYGAKGTATATTRAMLHVVSARAYAGAGDVDECIRHVHQAEDAYAERSPSDEPTWMEWYTEAQLAGDSGCAMFDAASHDPSLRHEAFDRLTIAAEQYSPKYARSIALCQARAAALLADQGEVEKAVAVGTSFVVTSKGIASHRLSEDSAMLRTHLAGLRRRDDVDHLDRQLALAASNA